MKKKTVKQQLASTMVGQLEIFIGQAKFARVNGAFGGQGIFKEDLMKNGISEKTFKWLCDNHYISYHEGRALWISNTNKFYPNRTIASLEETVKAYKESDIYKNWLKEKEAQNNDKR